MKTPMWTDWGHSGNYDATCRPCGIETTLADDEGQVWLRCACLPKPNAVAATFAEVSLNQNRTYRCNAPAARLGGIAMC